MNSLSKAVSRPRVIGGFAAVLAAGAFLGALALAGPSDETTPFDSSSLDPNGLMIAMSLETDPQQVALAAPRIESPQVVSPACSWESDGVAEICESDWPYPDVQVATSDSAPCYDDATAVGKCRNDSLFQEPSVQQATTSADTVVARAPGGTDGAVPCTPEDNDGDPRDCSNPD